MSYDFKSESICPRLKHVARIWPGGREISGAFRYTHRKKTTIKNSDLAHYSLKGPKFNKEKAGYVLGSDAVHIGTKRAQSRHRGSISGIKGIIIKGITEGSIDGSLYILKSVKMRDVYIYNPHFHESYIALPLARFAPDWRT